MASSYHHPIEAHIGGTPEDSNTPELVKISSGQLFLVRPGDARTPRECMYAPCWAPLFDHVSHWFFSYNDAMATVRKAQSVEHNFQLVVTRVFEEGEEDILDDEEESAFRNLWRLLTRHLILFRRFRTGFSRWRGVRIPRRLPGRPTDSCVERPCGWH